MIFTEIVLNLWVLCFSIPFLVLALKLAKLLMKLKRRCWMRLIQKKERYGEFSESGDSCKSGESDEYIDSCEPAISELPSFCLNVCKYLS